MGFNRLEPVAPDLEGEYDLGVQSQRLSLSADWLPACEIRGEGLLVELDAAAVAAWEQRPEVIARDRELQAGFNASAWWKGSRTTCGERSKSARSARAIRAAPPGDGRKGHGGEPARQMPGSRSPLGADQLSQLHGPRADQ